MVSDKGTPRLVDFGIFMIADDVAETTGHHNTSVASSLRWSAPEILVIDPLISKSEKSDVYAFASTCVEVGTLTLSVWFRF
jgi:serine/threonine protein kinase